MVARRPGVAGSHGRDGLLELRLRGRGDVAMCMFSCGELVATLCTKLFCLLEIRGLVAVPRQLFRAYFNEALLVCDVLCKDQAAL